MDWRVTWVERETPRFRDFEDEERARQWAENRSLVGIQHDVLHVPSIVEGGINKQ